MQLKSRLDEAVGTRRLLDHPFYQRWSAGELTRDELREYARQYWHFTLAFPTFVSGVHSGCADLEARRMLLENLIEEEHGAENHPELWLRFCEALGLARAEVTASEPNEATRALVDTMHRLTRQGTTHEGLAALYAYESQVPGVATAKIDGLAKWYAIDDPRQIAFFSVHQEADVHHSATAIRLLDRLAGEDAKQDESLRAAGRTLDALYAFLDAVTETGRAEACAV